MAWEPFGFTDRAARLARAMQTGAGMQLRTRPDAFVRSMVAAATVGPFLTALRDMRQARVRSARQPDLMPEPALMPTPGLHVATSRAA